jgi:hypothetical protein
MVPERVARSLLNSLAMSRKKRPFVVTLTLVAAACGGETAQDGGGNAGTGGIITNPPPTECPATMPENGTACAAPKIACTYGEACCEFGTAICLAQKWSVTIAPPCNPPPPLPCPGSPPVDGSSCVTGDVCSPGYEFCTYGACSNGEPAIEASCDGSVWHVMQKKCAQLPCETLDACGCFAREDCQAVSDSCICECDYACDGKPPCDCICGGGTYLGCKSVNE